MPDQFTDQIRKLEALRHDPSNTAALEEFDEETEQLILRRFGEATRHLEAYELAMLGEAETIVNIPQSAQEDATQDVFHKGIEQRRQVLEACLAEAAAAPVRPAPRPAAAPATKPRAAKKAKPAKKAAKKPAKKNPAKRKKPAPAKRKKKK